MDAAAELIREQGFPDLRVEEIAQRAGLSVGTFYLYFDGKTDLFTALVIDYTERLRHRLQPIYGGSGSVVERLVRSRREFLDFVEENAKGFLYFRDAGTVPTTVGRLSTWVFELHAGDLRPLLEEGMERGEITRQDPVLLAHAQIGICEYMAGYWLEHRDTCSRDQLEQFLFKLGGTALVRPAEPAIRKL